MALEYAFTKEEKYIEAGPLDQWTSGQMDQWTNGGTTKRMGTLVQPLKKPTANGNIIREPGQHN